MTDTNASQPAAVLFRFGPFQANLVTRDLRKHGLKIRLRGQPFAILSLLLEKPGQPVTREELHERLWPSDTFVDFEHGLNNAIKKLRDALGDTPEHSRYIETIPRLGYCFIAPVETIRPESKALAVSAPLPGPVPPTTALERRFPMWALAIAAAILIAAIVGSAFALRAWRGDHIGPGQIQSIVVLPLENVSGDSSQDYFAEGMTDELTTAMAKIQPLRIISRTSAQQYKKTSKSVPVIARELKVDAVLEGTVVRLGGRVRITAELVNAADHHLWADNFESDERDVLILQDEVAREIADEIRVKLLPGDQAQLAGASAIDPEAHDAYLEGLFFYYQETPNSLGETIRYAQRAIQLDPSYAEAYALLAACDYDRSQSRWGDLPNAVAAQRAKADALKALELKSTLAEPHVVLGAVAEGHEWNWAVAESEFKRAIELNPNLVTAHVGLAWHWIFMGRDDAAIQESNRALEIDPVSIYTLDHQLFILYYTGQYDQVISHAPKALEMYPNDTTAYKLLGRSYQAKGMYAEAVSAYQQQLQHEGVNPSVVAALGNAFKAGGIRSAWQWQLQRRLSRFHAGKAVEPYEIASRYSLLGQKNEAIEWINREYALRGQGMLFVRILPAFDNLHSDSRYQDLISRMNFPQ